MKTDLAEDQIFWFNNPKVLIYNIGHLYPNKKYSEIENLNSILRLFVLLGLFLYIWSNNIMHLLFSIFVGMLLTYYMYDKGISTEGFTIPEKNQYVSPNGNICLLPTKPGKLLNMYAL